jgi:HTH-type transcriptional regulator/antitoxin HigA
MEIKPIKTATDYAAALDEIDGLMSAGLATLERDRLDLLAALVEAYETKHFPMELPNPIDAIKLRMEQKVRGQTNRNR